MQAPTDQTSQRSEPDRDESAAPRLRLLHGPYRVARRVGIAVVGSTVLLVGIVFLVTPGPAFVVIPIGLGILSLEFAWAARWLVKIKDRVNKALPSARDRNTPAA